MRGVVALLWLFAAGCGDSTGGALVRFNASASGVSGTGGLSFSSALGTPLVLNRARLHLGAVYLNETVPTSGAAAQSCLSQGLYVGQVFGPLDVDLLSGEAQPFPDEGEGTTMEARTAEVWLTGGDINANDDPTPILQLEGEARLDGGTLPFNATVTIGSNRLPPVSDPALPSANPICRQRIVSPLLVELTLEADGLLTLQLDPRRLFDAVDFSSFAPDAGTYVFPDDASGSGAALFRGLRSSAVYSFDWKKPR
ncbi:MAG: hypothetical protein QM723_13125 [Myxococcaceae bacterium]